ncbi:Proline--tRNA ligase [Actinidia chinensis var. chinensis]|uniref:Proline--tRNA ligase n=1 Tax=Actinidia chinensis var. chinensis TaxID=1590841 RepID=A0A2R6RJQ8_ACTCC|nr:Proline--tRNA ligase [Actinidia chinensis var. chinensis]
MEKSRSFQDYPCSYSEVRLAFEDRTKSYSFNGPSDNPEVKRRKRVASYNMYAVEGKLKSSLRSSFKWIKNKFTDNYYDS